MARQYVCKNLKRRNDIAALSNPSINGLDFLEVDPADQRKLHLHFLFPLPGQVNGVPASGNPLTEKNFLIDGGVRIKGLTVASLDPITDSHVLTVNADAAGDFSAYTLRIVDSPDNPAPPKDFDPRLSEMDFSFKVNCPSDFDCSHPLICPEEAIPEPQIDYLAKDYSSLHRLIFDRLASIMPGWTESNASDLMVALVELLAYAGDYLSYYQDAASTEAYLETARKRISVRRHSRLLDYAVHDGCNSRVFVSFEVDRDGITLNGPVRDGTGRLTAGGTMLFTESGPRPVLRFASPLDLEAFLSSSSPEIFELMHDIPLYKSHNQIRFYTWDDDRCCLPRGATKATLIDDGLHLTAGDLLILEEKLDPAEGLPEGADPSHRQVIRLIKAERSLGPDPLTGTSYMEIEWGAEDALSFPLCISTVAGGNLVTDVSTARGNVALADNGRTVIPDATAANGDPHLISEAGRRLQLRLDQPGVTWAVPFDYQAATGAVPRPASIDLSQDPRKAAAQVEIYWNGELWQPARDLLEGDQFTRSFVAEMDDDGFAHLRFSGDVPLNQATPGFSGLAIFRTGNGKQGNVGAEAIFHVVTLEDGVTGVYNPLPASGGTDPEPSGLVKLYAPQAFRVQERAVTEEDYALIAQRHPEVQKAVATRRWTGSWYTVFVTVDRAGGLAVDGDFRDCMISFLDGYRMAGEDTEVEGPVYVPLDIVLQVCLKPGYLRGDVLEELLEILGNRDLPDGSRGFFHPDRFTFGDPVYLSSIIVQAMKVPGVNWVYAVKFQRWGRPDGGEMAAGVIEMGRLEIARLDNDPSYPENGKIEFIVEGGLL